MNFQVSSTKHTLHSHVLPFSPSTDYLGFLGSSGKVLWYNLIFCTNHILINFPWNMWFIPVLVEVLVISNTHYHHPCSLCMSL
jgi:hypothetical protein